LNPIKFINRFVGLTCSSTSFKLLSVFFLFNTFLSLDLKKSISSYVIDDFFSYSSKLKKKKKQFHSLLSMIYFCYLNHTRLAWFFPFLKNISLKKPMYFIKSDNVHDLHHEFAWLTWIHLGFVLVKCYFLSFLSFNIELIDDWVFHFIFFKIVPTTLAC